MVKINPKRLIEMAGKWQRMAAAKRRRISYPRGGEIRNGLVADKGHFVVYTIDKKRYMVPLEYLSRNVFIELLKLSEEQFGLPNHGARAITLPCDSIMFEYVISLIRGQIPEELEKALLTSIATCHQLASLSSLAQGQTQQQLILGY